MFMVDSTNLFLVISNKDYGNIIIHEVIFLKMAQKTTMSESSL